ncbi:S1C family serine protease [Natribacillus halophilus]|uniref:HtrA-like peptidase. Serine peptidase. MEROPS family S01B n=1 Tax=Natribacillus halophilus TaxID=549003 RepID=A0A1G8L216_9BACI|nr:trypsin-like peptidase domain-containing protein [Natribacillus halophilus]SDI49200.1 htrA-like peptidase. Serine peptidase. MEROPS family S01B [Natribacillus halophilus]
MGYYDDHVDNKSKENQKRRRGMGLSGFVGAILGALVVGASVALMQTDDAADPGAQDSAEEGSTNDDYFAGDTEQVDFDINTDVTEAVEGVSDAVVGVFNMQEENFWGGGGGPQGEPGGEGEGIEAGTGSGVIYNVADGQAFIVTNEHVIRESDQVEVSLSEGQRVEAEIVGEDIWTDLAVLSISTEDVEDDIDTVADFGDSDNLTPGEPAIAIGNPLGPTFARTVTQGIVSGVDRSIPVDLTGDGQIDWNSEVIQTDAAINQGNSGGPLLNAQGEVVGINSMEIAQGEGMGFAIPSSIALPVIEDIENVGEVQRPELGVEMGSISDIPSYHWQETLNLPEDVTAGVFITNVIQGSSADNGGLQEYDVIVAMDEQEIEFAHDLRMYLYTELSVGDEVTISFYRDGELQETTIELEEQQDSI